MSAVADEPITLELLARQQQRLLDEMGSMRDDMQVLTAMVMRLDGTVGLVLTELRANAQPILASRRPLPPSRRAAPRAEVMTTLLAPKAAIAPMPIRQSD